MLPFYDVFTFVRITIQYLTIRVAVSLGKNCNIGSKRPCCPLASDVEPSHVISTVHLWRRAVPLQTFAASRVAVVVINYVD